MTNKTTNTPPFRVKCVDDDYAHLTIGKEYDVVGNDYGVYQVKNDCGGLEYYVQERFEIVETPKDKQEFSVGDKVVINTPLKGVKVGDVATVIEVDTCLVKLSNPNWERSWWFYKDDVSLVADNNQLSHQGVIQAVIDGKQLEIQYADGTWDTVSPINTTLHQLTTLNFRLKTSLEDKRKAIIKKLLTTKVAVLCKCWDDDDDGTNAIEAITSISDDYTYPYMNNCLAYKNAYVIDDNGNEITNVE